MNDALKNRCFADIGAMMKYDLNPRQVLSMVVIRALDKPDNKTVRSYTDSSAGTITNVIDKLEALGLVKRTQSQNHIQLEVTEKGSHLLDSELLPPHNATQN